LKTNLPVFVGAQQRSEKYGLTTLQQKVRQGNKTQKNTDTYTHQHAVPKYIKNISNRSVGYGNQKTANNNM
jgi:hypothetical protein